MIPDKYKCLFILCLLSLPFALRAQAPSSKHEVYIDDKGLLRLSRGGAEASYFGVNYTLPFAYGYRSHKKLGINLEQAIDRDVYHLARLGINAFRVHVWDTEITDSLGNLQQNEHLRLFDYLIAKLEQRNIRIILTPIAFWGNGYPDPDEKTGSFVEKYGKNGSVLIPEAIAAQENYLRQFYNHVNFYTRKRYTDDALIIATEVNNEPHHSGAKELTTSYINRLVAAIKSTGWTKPVFYNISESPTYADAVAASKADGFSFQWYPTGLVAGHAQNGNLLPHVDNYVIPFDTIPAFPAKPRMIYEFESADVMEPYMYPAMARSFKRAGFQWATQFAYDPLGTAFANTEYQTHYLNLAYTPSKAISLMIAAQVFRTVPAFKSYGNFPADTTFGPFKLSHQKHSAEMNTDTSFYYANGSTSKPVNAKALKHIAGTGTSGLVAYNGSGAYFLDQLGPGCWRLEVMPDAIVVKDPFGKNELNQPVTRIVHNQRKMQINLPDLSGTLSLEALDRGNTWKSQVSSSGSFDIRPGTYLLRRPSASRSDLPENIGVLGLREFVAPAEGPFVANNKAETPVKKAVGSQSLILFDAGEDAKNLNVYSPKWEENPYFIKKDAQGVPYLNLQHKGSAGAKTGGIQVYTGSKPVQGSELYININLKSNLEMPIRITLIDRHARACSAEVMVRSNDRTISLPLSAFKPSGFVLLPRPYPGFQKFEFRESSNTTFDLKGLEKLQLMPQANPAESFEVDIYSIELSKLQKTTKLFQQGQ
jgi:hypothetical protein